MNSQPPKSKPCARLRAAFTPCTARPWTRYSGFIYQALAPAARFDGRTATLGVWVIGDEPCCLGIREDRKPIVHGRSPFVPHLVVE